MRAACPMALRLWGMLEQRLWAGGRATGCGGSVLNAWAICCANCQNLNMRPRVCLCPSRTPLCAPVHRTRACNTPQRPGCPLLPVVDAAATGPCVLFVRTAASASTRRPALPPCARSLLGCPPCFTLAAPVQLSRPSGLDLGALKLMPGMHCHMASIGAPPPRQRSTNAAQHSDGAFLHTRQVP